MTNPERIGGPSERFRRAVGMPPKGAAEGMEILDGILSGKDTPDDDYPQETLPVEDIHLDEKDSKRTHRPPRGRECQVLGRDDSDVDTR